MNHSYNDGSPEHDTTVSGWCCCIKGCHNTKEEYNHPNHYLNCLWEIKENKLR